MLTALEGRDEFLPDATTLAIEHLSQNENGFFLMVEGSQIDWAGHDNDSEYLIAEMLDFEKTIAVALDFAMKDGNTLVVVTADHETGGLALVLLRRMKIQEPVTTVELVPHLQLVDIPLH